MTTLLFILGCGCFFFIGHFVGKESGKMDAEQKILIYAIESKNYDDETIGAIYGAVDGARYGKKEGR